MPFEESLKNARGDCGCRYNGQQHSFSAFTEPVCGLSSGLHAASLKPGERTLALDVFRQLRPTLEAVQAGDEGLSISKSKIGVGILGVRLRA